MAVGCSHGILSDPVALKAVLKFKAAWKPHFTAHLGDCFDTTAFMKEGRAAESGGAKPIEPDMDRGAQFLEDYKPDLFMCGNHEDRLWKLCRDKNELIAYAAGQLVTKITMLCDRMKCKVLPWEYKQGFRLGNYILCHGTIFSEFAPRDMAEVNGNVIFAHAHRAGMATARRRDGVMGICVGHLMDPALAEYAKPRKSTYAWSQGFCWGYYNDETVIPWLHIQPQGQTEWVLPL